MKKTFSGIVPVLPSSDIQRDVQWYVENTGFELCFADHMYAVLFRENISIHLQWHSGKPDDPMTGGSVMRIFTEDVKPLFDEFVSRGTVQADSFRANTAWQTHEFGFYDLNGNAIFIVEDIV